MKQTTKKHMIVLSVICVIVVGSCFLLNQKTPQEKEMWDTYIAFISVSIEEGGNIVEDYDGNDVTDVAMPGIEDLYGQKKYKAILKYLQKNGYIFYDCDRSLSINGQ